MTKKKQVKQTKQRTQRTKCEVYSRVVGYYRPVAQWNLGKKAEWNERLTFNVC